MSLPARARSVVLPIATLGDLLAHGFEVHVWCPRCHEFRRPTIPAEKLPKRFAGARFRCPGLQGSGLSVVPAGPECVAAPRAIRSPICIARTACRRGRCSTFGSIMVGAGPVRAAAARSTLIPGRNRRLLRRSHPGHTSRQSRAAASGRVRFVANVTNRLTRSDSVPYDSLRVMGVCSRRDHQMCRLASELLRQAEMIKDLAMRAKRDAQHRSARAKARAAQHASELEDLASNLVLRAERITAHAGGIFDGLWARFR